jgi:hypothetical protein
LEERLDILENENKYLKEKLYDLIWYICLIFLFGWCNKRFVQWFNHIYTPSKIWYYHKYW